MSKTIVTPFNETLSKHKLELVRSKTKTLQINMGFLCNQLCKHCHLDAGPNRVENMTEKTVLEVVNYTKRGSFDTIDITGGAPEMNPCLSMLIEKTAPNTQRIMLRSNLSALYDYGEKRLFDLLIKHKVIIVASLPSVNKSQTDSQRGKGIFNKNIETLKKLNLLGYGMKHSGLELNLVSNPTGAFLPPPQNQAEKRFHKILYKKWGLCFNNHFTFANMPLGRFRDWLKKTGNLENYINKLANNFNPCTIDDLMCKTLMSISYDGFIYDCDFNLAAGHPFGPGKIHVSEMDSIPAEGMPIATGEHCYACTAGCGFT